MTPRFSRWSNWSHCVFPFAKQSLTAWASYNRPSEFTKLKALRRRQIRLDSLGARTSPAILNRSSSAPELM